MLMAVEEMAFEDEKAVRHRLNRCRPVRVKPQGRPPSRRGCVNTSLRRCSGCPMASLTLKGTSV